MDKEACVHTVLFTDLTLDQVLRQTRLVPQSSTGNGSFCLLIYGPGELQWGRWRVRAQENRHKC